MHAQNRLISTSGLKSDITVVFLDPIFLHDAEIPAICEHLGKNWHIYVSMDVQNLLAQNGGFGGKIG